MSDQQNVLSGGVELVIGTPGRILDCNKKKLLNLYQCHYIVVDECDKMVDEGFADDLDALLGLIAPENIKSNDKVTCLEQEKLTEMLKERYRTTMFFSATIPNELNKLKEKYLKHPAVISIGEPGEGKRNIIQKVYLLHEKAKRQKLLKVLDNYKGPKLVFLKKKTDIDVLSKFLEGNKINVGELHSNKDQRSREDTLVSFRNGKIDVLLASNVAARGIDVDNVTLVVNYDCPDNIMDYIHRIGRTGRNGKEGVAVTFLTEKDEDMFFYLREFIEKSGQQCRELDDHKAAQVKPGAVGRNEGLIVD